jgi:hypothetical protein
MTMYLYSPIIKGKANDLQALGKADPAVRALIKALIDIRPVPKGKTVDQHIKKLATDFSALPIDAEVFVDFYGFLPGQSDAAGHNATIAGYDSLLGSGRFVTPVYGFGRDDTLWPQLRRVVKQHKKGFCFRIELDDIDDESENTWEQILVRSAELGLESSQVDLFIDLRDIRTLDVDDLQEKVTDFLSLQPAGEMYRSICIAGSSAPKDVTVIPRDTVGSVYRNELKLWVRLKVDVPGCEDLIYGDYGIVHPDFAEDVPCGGTVNCKIRYTAGSKIFVFRGHVRAGDAGQTHALAAQVVSHDAYQGQDFSLGDEYIHDCAALLDGPGNPGNWVFADMNHHVVYATRQIERLIAEIEVDSTEEDIDTLISEY